MQMYSYPWRWIFEEYLCTLNRRPYMLFLLSPAKKLSCTGIEAKYDVSEPLHMEEAAYLVGKLKAKSPRSLKAMMGISDDLAGLNQERYQHWSATPADAESMQAALMFQGDVYQGLQAGTLNKTAMKYAQQHVRILSGLYGILRPLDRVMPYRLEMGSDFKVTPSKSNLYKYWGDTLKQDLEAENTDVIVNLASNEYAKAAKLNKVGAKVIAPQFKDLKNGEYKMISFFAKKARGLMCRYAIDQKVKAVEDLKGFDYEGYYFNNKLSTGDNWVFTRDKH